MKTYLVLFTAATQAKLAYAAAVAARKAALADIHAFYQSLVAVLKQTLGPTNQGLLPGFGIAPPKARTEASPEVKALAKVKAAATRKARGTLGKKERLEITGAAPAVINGAPAAPVATNGAPPKPATAG